MKNLFHRILETLNLSGRDWAALLLALLLAFSIWMIHNLSLKYNAYLNVPVVAKCNIPGHSAVSADMCEVGARCRATGYRLIRADIRRGRTVEIPFRQIDMKPVGGDLFYVTAAELQTYSHLIFGADVSVEYFLSDTLFFRFPVETFKKVPVEPITSLTYRKQYMADGNLEIVPDSVLVYGESFRLENVNAVYTKPIKYVDLSKNVRGVADIEKIKGVRLSENDVRYTLNVKRYVELTKTLPVEVINVPVGKELLVYPSSVEISMRCNFPLAGDPERGLRVLADYNDIQNSLSGRILLKPVVSEMGVISCDVSPVSVSFIVEEKR